MGGVQQPPSVFAGTHLCFFQVFSAFLRQKMFVFKLVPWVVHVDDSGQLSFVMLVFPCGQRWVKQTFITRI